VQAFEYLRSIDLLPGQNNGQSNAINNSNQASPQASAVDYFAL